MALRDGVELNWVGDEQRKNRGVSECNKMGDEEQLGTLFFFSLLKRGE